MNDRAPTLPTPCGSLPPEGAAPPAVRQSRSCGRNLDGRGRKSAPLEAVVISVLPANWESQIGGRNLDGRGRRVLLLKR